MSPNFVVFFNEGIGLPYEVCHLDAVDPVFLALFEIGLFGFVVFLCERFQSYTIFAQLSYAKCV